MIAVVAIYIAAGVFAGIVSAMFGVGGGFAVTPILLTALTLQGLGGDHAMHLTVGTTLTIIFINAGYAAFLRYRNGDMKLPLIMRFAPLVAVGAVLGSAVGDAMPGGLLQAIFIFFIVLTIVRGLLLKRSDDLQSGNDLSGVRGIEFWWSGSMAGLLGALMGPGPAIMIAPFLRKLRFSMATTVSTCSALAACLGLFGGGGYIVGGFNEAGLPPWSLGYLYLPAFVGLAAGSVFGTPLGIAISRRLDDHLQGRLYLVYLSAVLIVMLLHWRSGG